jgi:2-polyprenyl-6-methoxyphenol hydroxylase-like FAD-dependent oxidoreductase
MQAWSRGRVTLVGDACACASPLSGQGTGLALVGAYVLAGELAAAAGDHETAFVRYEQVMRPYTERNQRGAEALAKNFAPRTPREVQTRNFAPKLMRYIPLTSLMFKMAARATAKSSRAITLSRYAPKLPQRTNVVDGDQPPPARMAALRRPMSLPRVPLLAEHV